MDHFFDQIVAAERAGLYFVALQSALTIPDMCGKAETPEAGVRERWVRWYDSSMPASYTTSNWGLPAPFPGEVAYKYRCAALHEGSGVLTTADDRTRVVFIQPGATSNVMHLCTIGPPGGDWSVKAIDLPIFIRDIVIAGRIWLASSGRQEPAASNLERRVMRVWPDGYPPAIVGVPVIA